MSVPSNHADGLARAWSPTRRHDGRYLARYRGRDGKPRQAGVFDRRRDARARIHECVERENALAPGGTTLRTFIAFWASMTSRRPRTIATSLERLRLYVLPYLPDERPAALQRSNPNEPDLLLEHLTRYHAHAIKQALIERRLSKTTIDNALGALRTLYTDAIDLGLATVNPASALYVRAHETPVPRREPRSARILSTEAWHALVDALPPLHRPAAWALALSGCRPQELFAMDLREWDPGREMVRLHQTADRYGRLETGLKTTHHIDDVDARSRWTLLPREVVELANAHGLRDRGWVTRTPTGKVWAQRNFYRDVWTPAVERAGIGRVVLGDLRHSFASWLFTAGVPLSELAAWLGHSLRAGGATARSPDDSPLRPAPFVASHNTTTRHYIAATDLYRDHALGVLRAVFFGEPDAFDSGRVATRSPAAHQLQFALHAANA